MEKKTIIAAFEGIDGSGKSVQFQRLKAYWKHWGKRSAFWIFPIIPLSLEKRSVHCSPERKRHRRRSGPAFHVALVRGRPLESISEF